MPIAPFDVRQLRLYPGVGELARELERVMGESYVELLDQIVKSWQDLGPALTPTAARRVVEELLRNWPDRAIAVYADSIDRIFWTGFMVGVADTGVQVGPDHGDQMALDWLKRNPQGFIPALRNFAEGERRFFEDVLHDAYAGVDVEGRVRPFDLDDMVGRVEERSDAATYKIERVIRTETAKATSLGRIAAWENDSDRYLYWYHWVATHDERTKDVSLLFEREGPYEFDQIRKRWVEDHNQPWPVTNRHTGENEYQTSAYNCRCTAARTPKEPGELLAQGLVTREQYEAMAVA